MFQLAKILNFPVIMEKTTQIVKKWQFVPVPPFPRRGCRIKYGMTRLGAFCRSAQACQTITMKGKAATNAVTTNDGGVWLSPQRELDERRLKIANHEERGIKAYS